MSQWTSSFSLIGPTGPAGSFGLTGTTFGDYIYYDGAEWEVGSTLIRLGSGAGQTNQGAQAIALGQNAGNTNQSASAVAIGDSAGRTNQGIAALAFGGGAGYDTQGNFATAIGNGAGYLSQGIGGLAVGNSSGYSNQGTYALAVGNQAGESNQGQYSVAIGYQAGQASNLGQYAVAIGAFAAQNSSNKTGSIAVGWYAGNSNQGQSAIAIGQESGYSNQSQFATAVGFQAGYSNQGNDSVAIGTNAGSYGQATTSVAIGYQAGCNAQSTNSVAIGTSAGSDAQGSNSIAIGYKAGESNQVAGSIILNAGASALNGNNAGLYINPIREVAPAAQAGLFYDTVAKEVIHNSIISLSSPNTVVVAGNIVPNTSLAYSLGTSSLRYADAFFGPGSINIAGPSNASATIGTDSQGIIYTQSGFASPFINIGPAQLTPQAVGGWKIGPTGTQGTPGFGLVAQELQANGGGPTGPIYSLINQPTGPTGSTGQQGEPGATGINGVSGGLTFYLDSDTVTVTAGNPAIGTLPLTPNLGAQTTITYVTTGAQNVLVGKFTTAVGALSSTVVPPGLWDLNIFAAVSNPGNGPSFYYSVYQVDADGLSNPTLIASGSNEPVLITNLQSSKLIYDTPLYVPYYLLTDSTKRIQIQLFVNGGGTNRTAYFEFRSGAVSHLHTTLAITPGSTGPAGPTGQTGPTGPISLNYICQARLTTDQTITSNTDTRILFTDEYDPNNWWTGSNTFNPTINGYYLVTAAIWWAAGETNLSNQTNVQIRQNGSIQKAIVQSPIEWNSGNTQIVTRIIQLNGSTDYLDITAYTGNTTSQVVQAGSGSGSWFSAALQ
jgi:hypothetical protein